jgi:hypothetical protein
MPRQIGIPMTKLHSLGLLGMLALSACADFPKVTSHVEGGNSGYLELIPLEQITQQAQDFTISPATMGDLSARIARLRAQAKAISGPVMSSSDKARLLAALNH